MASDPRPYTRSLEGFFPLLDLPTASLPHRSSVSPSRADSPTLFGPKVSSLSGSLRTIALSPLAATLMDQPASVANKRLTSTPNPLDATLTKNAGVGGPLFQPENCRTFASSYTLLSG